MLVAAGAEKFAADNGIPLCAPEELVTKRSGRPGSRCLEDSHAAEHHLEPRVRHGRRRSPRFKQNRLIAGTSTGGTCCKFPGRVGDSPLIGCGCYADADSGGVSCTGHGEGIMKIVMAKMATDLLAAPENPATKSDDCRWGIGWGPRATIPTTSAGGDAQSVADACVRKLDHRAHTTGGLILLDRNGNPAAAFNTSRMAYGFINPDDSITIAP